jgi:hypothetical protein
VEEAALIAEVRVSELSAVVERLERLLGIRGAR